MTFTIYDDDLGKTDEEASDSTLPITPTSIIPVDKLATVQVVWDNVDGTNADDTTKLSVADNAGGNTWLRAGECQFSPGGVALDGLLIGIFYCVVVTQIEVTHVVTVTSTANGTGKGGQLAAFNRDSAKTIAVAGKGYQRVAAASAYTVTVGSLPSAEHLWIGSNGIEAPKGSINNQDTTFTVLTGAGSNNWGGSGGGSPSAHAAYKIATDTTETYDRTAQDVGDRATVLVAFVETVGGGGGGAVVDPFGMSGFFGA